MITATLWMATALAGETLFHPGEGPELAALPAGFEVLAEVMAWVDDPVALRRHPQVALVEVKQGDGHVVRVVPAPGIDPVDLANTLWSRPDVRWAHPDLRVPIVAHTLPNDPLLPEQWHLVNDGHRGGTPGVDIDAELAWTLSTGSGQLIAVLDTGIDIDHPDLSVISGHDYVGNDDDSNPDPEASNAGHGTSAGGIIAARGNNGLGVTGVAYDADLYGIRFIGGTSLQDLYDGFVEATRAGASVISNSWGFGDECTPFPSYALVLSAMSYAETQGRDGLGTAVVFSAGNGNCDIGDDGLQKIATVISVAATGWDDDKEWYSSFGDPVDVTAPSGNILTTDVAGDVGYQPWGGDPDYTGFFSGTSASAPVVSGVLALMFAANERLTAADAREVLCLTATRMDHADADYDERGWSPYYGCGRVDAGAAVAGVADLPPDVPTATWPPPEVGLERAVLGWEATDPDADRLDFDVRWWRDGEAEPSQVTTAAHQLDLSGELAIGDVVRWTVTSRDAWGPSEVSAEQVFTVVAPPEPPEPSGTCATSPVVIGWLPAVLLAISRRRSRSPRPAGASGRRR